jgi:hypothetical protein
MSTEIIYGALALHTYLALISATCFYFVLLEAANRHVVRAKRLSTLSFMALMSAFLSWGAKLSLLREYFSGASGFTTDSSITSNVSFFTISQTYIFPIVILFGIMLFLVISKEGHHVSQKPSIRNVILLLSFLGFTLSAILMFLGVLIP